MSIIELYNQLPLSPDIIPNKEYKAKIIKTNLVITFEKLLPINKHIKAGKKDIE